MGKVLATILLTTLAPLLVAQVTRDSSLNHSLEALELFESNLASDASSDLMIYQDHIQTLKERPIDINSASYDELVECGIFSKFQCEEIVRYRNNLSQFVSKKELTLLHGFDDTFVQSIVNLIALEPIIIKTDKGIHHDLMIRSKVKFPQTDATKNAMLNGGPIQYLLRYKLNYQSWRFSMVSEKDIGESWRQIKSPLPSHALMALQKSWSQGLIKQMNLGSYQLRWGQGLLFWNGLAFRKSALTNAVAKHAPELSSYSSPNESNYLNGGAIKLKFGDLSLTTALSHKLRDASSTDSTFSSIYTDGLHRSQSETNRQNSLKETLVAQRVTWNGQQLKVSGQVAHLVYNKAKVPGTQLYQLNQFEGTSNSWAGVDFQYYNRGWSAYGEWAISSFDLARSGVVGLDYSRGAITTSINARNLGSTWFAPYANVFSERSNPQNESGFYTGITWLIATNWTLRVYQDLYKFPAPTSTSTLPTLGKESLVQIDYKPTDQLEVYARFQHETRSISQGETIDTLSFQTKTKLRLHAKSLLGDWWRITSRIQVQKLHTETNELATLVYLDLTRHHKKYKGYWSARYTRFNAPSFQNALYSYENDVLYSYSVTANYRNGHAFYVLFKRKLSDNISLWAKGNMSYFPSEQSLGSGIASTSGPISSSLTLQLRLEL